MHSETLGGKKLIVGFRDFANASKQENKQT